MGAETSADKKCSRFPISEPQILHLLQDCSYNIRHAKVQQWVATFYTLSAYAALVGLAQILSSKIPKAFIFLGALAPIFGGTITAVTVIVICGTGVWFVGEFEKWMNELRNQMNYAERKYLPFKYKELSNCGGNHRSHLCPLNFIIYFSAGITFFVIIICIART